MVGDLGETANSTQAVAGLVAAQPHLLINVGDYSCAGTCSHGMATARAQLVPPSRALLPMCRTHCM